VSEHYAGISNLDINAVLELVDERVSNGSTQRIDMAMLPLVAAEVAILQLEETWPYVEDSHTTIKQMRQHARKIAKQAIDDWKKVNLTNLQTSRPPRRSKSAPK
jgi:hypothetical protein